MKDCYYTPAYLAKKLIKYVQMQNVNSVADFTVGGGELLRAALKRWPSATCYGTDISEKSIASLKVSYPEWKLGRCDFLNPRSVKSCKTITLIKNSVDLILLNPPFSCVGGTRHLVKLNEKEYFVSTAMYFVVQSLQYLSNNGCLYAILPNSVAYSKKDEEIWKVLQNDYRLKVIEESNTHHFDESSSKILLVSINCSQTKGITRRMNRPINIDGLSIFRGKLRMHQAHHNPKAKTYLIHTTNLQNNKIAYLAYKCNSKNSIVSGPALLIPRVGAPSANKIVIIKNRATFVLSDCVIAIKSKESDKIKKLYNHLISYWKDIDALYKGTGAKYVTVERLAQYINQKDFETKFAPMPEMLKLHIKNIAI